MQVTYYSAIRNKYVSGIIPNYNPKSRIQTVLCVEDGMEHQISDDQILVNASPSLLNLEMYLQNERMREQIRNGY